MKKVCVLTGAGISAESGLKTFRDDGGLWEGHDVMQVASIEGWMADPEKVLRFYNLRRNKLKEVQPNKGHIELVRLEKFFNTVIITQNVDDLHERAGSSRIIHLHGELNKVRSVYNDKHAFDWGDRDIALGDLAEDGGQIRPHIVWFGEQVPMLESAIVEMSTADYILIVGTSMQVYPAASLTAYAPRNCEILYVDPRPSINYELQQAHSLKTFEGPATKKVAEAIEYLLSIENLSD